MVRCHSSSTRSLIPGTSMALESTLEVPTAAASALYEPTLPNSCERDKVTDLITSKQNSTGKRGTRGKKGGACRKARVSLKTSLQDKAHVFVDNFHLGITEDDLQQLFQSCGTIKHLSISCSGGLLLPRVRVDLDYFRGHFVQRRAIVRFSKAKYAAKAVVELDGLWWRDSKIVVSRTPFVLPEFMCKLQQSLEQHGERRPPKSGSGQANRLLRPQPTVLIEGESTSEAEEAEDDGFWIFGFLFPNVLHDFISRARSEERRVGKECRN